MRRGNEEKSVEQLRLEASERIRGDANPMRRPEVAARLSQSLRERLALDASLREMVQQNLAKGRDWTPERRLAASQRNRAAWTPEMREVARQRSVAYQERVRAALAASPVKV